MRKKTQRDSEIFPKIDDVFFDFENEKLIQKSMIKLRVENNAHCDKTLATTSDRDDDQSIMVQQQRCKINCAS